MSSFDGSVDSLAEYDSSISSQPSLSLSTEKEEEKEQQQQHNKNTENDRGSKNQRDELMKIIHESVILLFRDQYDEPFAKIFVKDHFEIISIKSHRFERFLSKIYYDKYEKAINNESILNIVQTLQAKAEFGDLKYNLSLRVAEYNEDIYYDLTDEKHQCIKISSNGKWEILSKTPVPLFRRYNQTSQSLPDPLLIDDESKDPLETFFSEMTNIKDPVTRMLVKVIMLSYFIPNIPHIIMMIHGGKGSAKSTFQNLIKNIVDPAKPSLLTLPNDISEFIQQLAHNYLATYDNIKYVHKWLSDESCKAVTGIGQTKRRLYTDDEDKIYEFKHCLNFNGINTVFSEPDIIDRSIIVELDEIDDEHRKTEQEIWQDFYVLRPKLMTFIFDILAKAILIKPTIKIKELPRMADSAINCEAISRALGYQENEFIIAYYNNIGFQNSEIIDSNSLALAIKKFVEKRCENNDALTSNTLFEGKPLELLGELNEIAKEEEGIDTNQKEWPKNRNWLVKRLKSIKSSLQQVLGIKISINRDSKKNTSIIKMVKNNSGISGEYNLSPANESLSPYLENLSPVSEGLSPEENQDLSIKSAEAGYSGDSGDKSDILPEKEDRNRSGELSNSDVDAKVGYREPFYY